MKRILSVFAIVAVVTTVLIACNSSSGTKIDATELAQFKAWKAEAEKPVVSRTQAKRSGNYQSPKMVSQTEYPAKAVEKKGWSKSAKGAVIGAGSGAVLGAVINKRNRAVGAVIGGVIGGGVGYGVGRSMDKKDGRS
ncbi:MAG TPA: YMGG-like glycine zipper-containing protein [Chitinophagaceae bacterium]|nr:YMGG-like glycine zipper-containing protein [Chitinophagaceae bacterium]